ncbi:hypothetical protein FOHLNKBM_5684 [Methylobacterium longum]|nr:hypothetical protein FOHLNKBM_5684 [Methylobacterium longum]
MIGPAARSDHGLAGLDAVPHGESQNATRPEWQAGGPGLAGPASLQCQTVPYPDFVNLDVGKKLLR